MPFTSSNRITVKRGGGVMADRDFLRHVRQRQLQNMVYRIALTIRGRAIVKEYRSEREFEKWKLAYELQMLNQASGIECMKAERVVVKSRWE